MRGQKEYKADFGSIDWESPMEGLRFKAARRENKQIRLVEYTKTMPPHWCEKGHFGYVLRGEFEITFEGKTVTYKTGDGISIPSGAEHKHMGKALTDVVEVVYVEEL